ncbi:hypothetical protein ACQKGO_03415 [Corallococcus interemptor]|uniref:hypothetical protein n=1 Tax=Corallococcus interemptor TaxID=2316720 RepID=UPI003CFC28AF
MSTSAALPSAFSLPGGAGLLALVERVFSLVRRERMTAQERALLDHVRELSGTFGVYVLEAEDRDDLIARVDAVIGDPQFRVAQQRIWEGGGAELLVEMTWKGLDEALDEAMVPDAMEQVLGAASTPFLRDLHLNLSETFRCVAHLLNGAPLAPEAVPALETLAGLYEGEEPLAFISAPEVPVPVAEALLASMRLDALLVAPTTLLFQQAAAKPWLKLAIAELLATSSKRSLALMAAVSGAEVSVELLPMDQRLELTGLEQHSKAVLSAYARFNMAAERSGESVYPSGS